MRTAMDWLKGQGIAFRRPTDWQLKIGNLNFYPDKGTIFRDGGRHPLPQRGLNGLKELLRRDAAQDSAGQDADDEPPRLNPLPPGPRLVCG